MATKANRPQRTPLANRSVLGIKGKEPGYVYRIVNDTGDRISMFQERGYEIVTDNTIKIGDRRVGKASADGSPVQVSVGGGIDGYLMRIKDEYYKEDQDYKEQQLKELEQSMRKDATNGMYGKLDISTTGGT
jgi:hypothetical protein